MPDQFMRAVARDELGQELPSRYAVGMIFLGKDEAAQQRTREAFAAAAADQGVSVAGWRQVPIDESVLGPVAWSRLPALSQEFPGGAGLYGQQFAMRLSYVRRKR